MKTKCWDINSQYQIIQYYSGQSRRGKLCHEAPNIYVAFSGLRCPTTLSSGESGIFDTLQFYRKIDYLTREFRVKLHAKTDIARIASNHGKKFIRKTAIILFGFILSTPSRKPFQRQLSKLSFCLDVFKKFCSQLTSAVSLHAQVVAQLRFHAKYSLFDNQSDCEFSFSYAILSKITQGG